ncbi:ATP-binding protein [Microbacterium oleivorans]|uniref:ATP-binding protein n=1 Tax=Microbacterium oleivorans TaxID=273677 RepID=UPI0034393492
MSTCSRRIWAARTGTSASRSRPASIAGRWRACSWRTRPGTPANVSGRSTWDGGSGIGLASVAASISEHRGTLEIDSEVGVGTTVTITLPLA